MKTFSSICFLAVALAGCGYERTYNTTSDSLREVLLDEKWRIKFFAPSDQDRTGEFVNFEFVFTSNNVVSCFNSQTHELKAGSYGIRGTDTTAFLSFNFINSDSFQDFNYEWQVMEITTNLVRSEHGQGGNGSTSYLTFEK